MPLLIMAFIAEAMIGKEEKNVSSPSGCECKCTTVVSFPVFAGFQLMLFCYPTYCSSSALLA